MTYKIYYFFCILLLSFNQLISQNNFIEGQNIPSTFPTAAEFADFDNDGDIDLVRTMDRATGLNDLNANEIWLNDGSGNFTLHQSFGNSESRDLAIGDLDGDNDLDIFVANGTYFIGLSDVSSNKIWLNDGSANFTNGGQSLGVRISLGITLADFDGDLDLDAYVANSGDTNNQNSVWFNNGSGQFSNSGLLGNQETQDVKALDIDNDNDIDVITANCCSNSNNSNNIWLNNGSGFFSIGQNIGNFYSSNVSIADLDGDLDKDLLFSNTFEDSKTYINDGNGNFSFHSNVIDFPTAHTKTLKFSDFDNDSDNDIIVTIFTDSYKSRILINDGFGNFTEDFQFSIRNTIDVAIGDIDNDGDKDVFMLNINNQNSEFWINEKELSTEEHLLDPIKAYPNPTKNNTLVDLGKIYSKIEINMHNVLGQKIYSKVLKNSQIIDLELKGSKGLYFVTLKFNEIEIKTIKLIKN